MMEAFKDNLLKVDGEIPLMIFGEKRSPDI